MPDRPEDARLALPLLDVKASHYEWYSNLLLGRKQPLCVVRMTTPQDDQAALDIARGLAHAGIPIFIAPPSSDPKDTSGFRLPSKWEQTQADPSVLDRWQPGWAVCAVMGHGLDLVDLDLYDNADLTKIWTALQAARHYGMAGTASGGIHVFVASVGMRSKNKLFQGIDFKSGTPEGKGRGFAFIAPTVKPSKVTGELSPYYWQTPPSATSIEAALEDRSSQALAALLAAAPGVNNKRNGQAPSVNGNGNGHSPVDLRTLADPFQQAKPSLWRDIAASLRDHGRNDGVMRLACSLRETSTLNIDDAIAYMYEHVWPHIDQAQGGHEFPAEEFEGTIRAQWRQYPGGVAHIQQAEIAAEDLNAHPLPGSVLELTDAYITDRVAHVLHLRYCWARGLNWMMWNKYRWVPMDVSEVWNDVRKYFIWLHSETAKAGADQTILGRLNGLLAAAKIRGITDLSRGHELIVRDAEEFDAHPDVINTMAGIVSLRTGEITPHDPAMMLTKLTSGNYRPGFTHPDWEQALTALDAPEQKWYQARIGQAITGYPPSDGIMPVLQGSGENGKSSLTTDGPVKALGDYADMASHKLITAQKAGSSEHSTEMADLRGQRLLIGEELAEGRAIDVTALKRIQDVGRIKARYVHKDNITFSASHSLMCTTNYVPVISETDHGTWRRLALVKFSYTFRKPGEPLITNRDRRGDPQLKYRIRYNYSDQHDAIVTWAVDGAIAWFAGGQADAPVTDQIKADTLTWRASSDHILGFWNEHLVKDTGRPGEHSPCISAAHLLEVFNAWLVQNGHGGWSKELFAMRFGGHEMTTGGGVVHRVTRALNNLSWCTDSSLYVGGKRVSHQMRVWVGVRWQKPDDQQKSSQGDEGDDPPVNVPSNPFAESYPGGSSPSSPCQTESPSASPEPDPPAATARDDPSGTQMGTADHDPVLDEPSAVVTQRDENVDPPRLENPGAVSPPEPERPGGESPPQPKKPRAPKLPKRIGPDPELAGPVYTLPAAVNREGVVLSCTLGQARQLAGRRELTADVETTGYPIGHPDYRLRTVQLGGEDVAVVFDADDPEHQAVIRELLTAAEILHAHSAVADLVPLERAGLCGEDAWLKMDDTVLRAKLADPRQSGSDADGLKQLAADVVPGAVIPEANEARKKLFASGKWLTDTDALTPPERSGWGQVDSGCETMIVYAASDVLDTAPLPRLLPPVDPRILAREQVVQRICARVSHRGLRLDGEHIRELAAQHETAKAEVAERVRDAGIENPGSAQQVGRALAERGVTLPRTKPSATHPDGQPSAAEAILTPLAAGSGPGAELAADVLAYREHATILGLTLNPFRVLCERGDGRVRPTIYTLGTNTGRMSAVRPNLQQIKRTGGLRACITADEGMVLVSADFQAVELRVAAALAQDQALYEMITEGDKCRVQQLLAKAAGNAEAAAYWKDQASLFDLHWKIARQVWGPQAGKGDRYNAKRSVFGRLYGAGIRKIAATLGISEGEARAVADTLDALAPGVAHWSAEMQQYVRNGGTSIQAYSGRTIWLDKGVAHKAANYAIQGNAREALADGLLKWEQTQWAGSVILPVHDEIVTVVPAADAAEATRTLVEVMSTELNGMKIIAEPSEPAFAWQDAS